ncbi:hypothetical protein BJ508DRAFT_310901 [Ascobolus immersus RN42]|uniref:Uncharacterized protein n=1 Tax=Ascobolus immersus RN42 TaxID=1160509 RepID=A0A3N4HRZ1_ASCIM|nr:hypothetical protein BJ508DRAFT_310901 [Ascobolus immersus RN42]
MSGSRLCPVCARPQNRHTSSRCPYPGCSSVTSIYQNGETCVDCQYHRYGGSSSYMPPQGANYGSSMTATAGGSSSSYGGYGRPGVSSYGQSSRPGELQSSAREHITGRYDSNHQLKYDLEYRKAKKQAGAYYDTWPKAELDASYLGTDLSRTPAPPSLYSTHRPSGQVPNQGRDCCPRCNGYMWNNSTCNRGSSGRCTSWVATCANCRYVKAGCHHYSR